jgi:hypothetical protein
LPPLQGLSVVVWVEGGVCESPSSATYYTTYIHTYIFEDIHVMYANTTVFYTSWQL